MPISNDQLLQSIKSRKHKQSPFCYGIITADLYVKTLEDCLGLDACYRYASRGRTSFNDVMEKAAKTLVYSNEEMKVEEIGVGSKRLQLPSGMEMPKNTLMVFRHVLSTSTKDRDGDVLHSDGAAVDPKMLLLWQHVHTLPIGKMLSVAEQNEKRLCLFSAIVDMNELCHDSAVMVDNDMGRFSHGFRALDFVETKAEDEKASSSFDIKTWEALEESIVSVPSNPEAGTEEVLLSLVEGGKLTSPLMKEFGKNIREVRPVRLPVTWTEKLGDYQRKVTGSVGDLKTMAEVGLIGGNGENQSGDGSKAAGGKTGGSSPSKETDEAAGVKKEEESADEKVSKCPECGGVEFKDDGECKGCGWKPGKPKKPKEEGKETKPLEKALYELDGSWEYITRQLVGQCREKLVVGDTGYVYGVGTFPDYVLVCKSGDNGKEDMYYRFSWEMKNGSPVVIGEHKQVEIHSSVIAKHFAGEKLGRVLSKANETRIGDAKEDIDEAAKMDVTRPCKALLNQASSKLGGVLSSLGSAESGGTKTITVKEAIAFVLANASESDQKKLADCLSVLKCRKSTDQFTKQYAGLIGR